MYDIGSEINSHLLQFASMLTAKRFEKRITFRLVECAAMYDSVERALCRYDTVEKLLCRYDTVRRARH